MPLTVLITLDTLPYVFESATGIDAGDYADPQGAFVQGNITVTRPDTPLTVEFRADRNSDRVEVVFSLFKCWNASPVNLGPYSVLIADGETSLATVEVPCHYWGSRWRWQSAPRPVRATPAQLIAAKLLPSYANTLSEAIEPVDWNKIVYNQPMDGAGINPSMDSTGERYDIGPITEWCAQYLLSESDEALAGIMAQGEAAATFPCHFKDENTHAPVDFETYPVADWYWLSGYFGSSEKWIATSRAANDASTVKCPWGLDYAHFPNVSFLPFLLTGDPYHLEELQYQLTWCLGFTVVRDANDKRLIPQMQTRGWAWTLRTLFQVVKSTPLAMPSWLKPQAYWQSMLTANLNWFTDTYVNGTTPASTLFHAALKTASSAPWEEDFLAFILGWGVLLGFGEWQTAYEWKLGNTLARTNGTSGWPRQWPSPYHYGYGPSPPDSGVADPNFNFYESWNAAWDAYAANPRNNVPPQPWPDTTSFAVPDGLRHYLIYTRGVLALAVALGETQAEEPFAFVDAMVRTLNFMTGRWSVAA